MPICDTKHERQCLGARMYEGHSKSFAIQYDAQMTRAKFLCYYSTISPLTAMHMLRLSNSSGVSQIESLLHAH